MIRLAPFFAGALVSALVSLGISNRGEEMPTEWYSVSMADTYPNAPTIHVHRQGEASYLFTVKLVPFDTLDKDKDTRKHLTYCQRVRVHVHRNGFEPRHIGLASITAPADDIEFDPR